MPATFTSQDQVGEKLPEPTTIKTQYSDEHAAVPYAEFEVVVEDFCDFGHRQGAVAAKGDDKVKCKIVRCQSPVSQRTVSFHAVRDVKWPNVPSPTEFTDDGTLQSYRIRRSFRPIADGKAKSYTLDGVYIYLLDLPVDPSDGLPVVKTPVLKNEGQEDVVPPDAFVEDMIP